MNLRTRITATLAVLATSAGLALATAGTASAAEVGAGGSLIGLVLVSLKVALF